MTSPQPAFSPLSVRERAACMCDHGDVCSSFAPGHALHLIQARLASATPSDWVDAIVESSDAVTGDLVVRDLDGTAHALWNGSGAALEGGACAPVAVHRRFHVLGVGRTKFNVATA